MASESIVEHPVSAGGVVCRVRQGVVELVVCQRRNPLVWGLPKGTPESGETLEETAIREVNEETGLQVKLDVPLGSIKYWFMAPDKKTRYNKTVHFYLMHTAGGDLGLHDVEFDEVHWLPAESALRLMTYTNEARIVTQAIAHITEGFARCSLGS